MVIPVREGQSSTARGTRSPLPHSNAVVLYLMDVSGSMTDDQKEIVRIEAFWIDTWLKSQYDGVTTRYIIHDAVAREVDQHTFYHTRESGGTRISSAYNLANKIIEADHPPADWNVYVLHFSDGDNWGEDNRQCVNAAPRPGSCPSATCSATASVESPYGSRRVLSRKPRKPLRNDVPNRSLSEIRNKDGIYESIKEFLGRGRKSRMSEGGGDGDDDYPNPFRFQDRPVVEGGPVCFVLRLGTGRVISRCSGSGANVTRPRMVYCDGDLLLVSPSYIHRTARGTPGSGSSRGSRHRPGHSLYSPRRGAHSSPSQEAARRRRRRTKSFYLNNLESYPR